MSLLPFGELPPYRPRRFVPAVLALGDWEAVAPFFDQLEARAAGCASVAELERWLLDAGELAAALDEERARRYIAKTCHTDNAEAEKAYLQFVEVIDPALKPRQFTLAELFLKHPFRHQLPPAQYEVFDRATALQVELYRPENIPLETEEAKVGNEYNQLSGSLTVEDIQPFFNAGQDPRVKEGTKTEAEVLKEFIAGFEGKGGNFDGTVTLEEWIDYYEDISSSIDEDDLFGTMFESSWSRLKTKDKQGNVVHQLSNALRICLKAPPGYKVVVADKLQWLQQEAKILATFQK
jgi:hypothetical protein